MATNLRSSTKIYLFFKRFFDLFFSLLLILLLIPIWLVISVIVIVDTHGFPIFRQRRMGAKNREFLIFKFRTMNINTPKDVPTHLLENPDNYITKCGKRLRKLSIDELPQLFNVLIGQMSLIGPRPALWNQQNLIDLRITNGSYVLKPGITGWAQINGRDLISDEEKADLDRYYFENLNIFLDIKIFFLSFVRVLSQKDVLEGKQG